jgi:type VI secretion system VgrG family protein
MAGNVLEIPQATGARNANSKSARFEFICAEVSEHTFAVVELRGREAISHPYRFDLLLAFPRDDLDLDAIIDQAATLKIRAATDSPTGASYGGIVSSISAARRTGSHALYEAVLEPALTRLRRFRYSNTYLDKSVVDVVREVMESCGFREGTDYEFRLVAAPPSCPYTCQFEESCFDFISRLMEREGLYYFFETGPRGDKLIITDSRVKHSETKLTIAYRPYGEPNIEADREVFYDAACERSALPRKVIITNYNYEKASLRIRAESVVSGAGNGEVMLYGEHVEDNDQAQRVADLRAQEILCRGRIFRFQGTAIGCRAAMGMKLERHFRADFNTQYTVIEVIHEGSQTGAMLFGLGRESGDGEERPAYRCEVRAIPAEVPYRPPRTTPVPRIHGMVSAFVDSEGSGQYAELDDQGRYKVQMPFFRENKPPQRATQWIRFASPYSGPDSGFHFPLRKNTEVMLAFAGGDVDRPVIVAAVPNSVNRDLVTNRNATRNVLRTGGGNLLEMEDRSESRQVRIVSPSARTAISMGAPVSVLDNLMGVAAALTATSGRSEAGNPGPSPSPANLQLFTDGTTLHRSGESMRLEIGSAASAAKYEETAKPGDGDLFAVLVGAGGGGLSPGNLVFIVGQNELRRILTGYSLVEVGENRKGGPLSPGEYKVTAAGDITMDSARDYNLICSKQNTTVREDKTQTVLGMTTNIKKGATLDIFMGNAINLTVGALERGFLGSRFSLFVAPKIDLHLVSKTDLTVGKFEMTLGLAVKYEAGIGWNFGGIKIKNAATSINSKVTALENAVTLLRNQQVVLANRVFMLNNSLMNIFS